jgi:hypothetical protein
MSSILRRTNESDYIVKPFTIDNKGAETIDDGFSITANHNGTPCLNVHISLVGLEFLKNGYDLNSLKNETRSVKIKDYIGRNTILDYSLQVGLRKTLTLKIMNYNGKAYLYSIACEEIDIIKNCCYSDRIIDSEFDYYMGQIFRHIQYRNNHKLVTDLMGCYSAILSQYLFYRKIQYIIKNRYHSGPNYRKGSFTSPMRKQDSLINQFIFLTYLKDTLNYNFTDELLLFEKKEPVHNGNEKTKTLVRDDIYTRLQIN